MESQKTITELLQHAGIDINGRQPYDLQVYDSRFYNRVLMHGSLGLGEAYMLGWWDCDAIDVSIQKMLQAHLEQRVKSNISFWWQRILYSLFNQQSRSRAIAAIDQHYNISNDLFKAMLDPHMMYSCGYWENTEDLHQAQTNKLELICRKLHLKRGMKVLEIGCGWGGFAAYAAQNYDVEVTGLTISTEQEKLARERCKGLNVDIRLQDYRDVHEPFDRILSIGMFEHVGYKNYPVYMKVIDRNLKADGISLLHTIGSNETSVTTDPWLDKYIFPDSRIPSAVQVARALEGEKLVMLDWHNFGRYYDYTLMAWLNNFNQAWPSIRHNYSEKFRRMWVYYLSSCAACFRAGKNNLWQIVFAKQSYPKLYRSVRSVDPRASSSKERFSFA